MFLTHQRQPFGLRIAATVPLGPCHASLLLVARFDDAIGPIIQEPDQLAQVTQCVKHVAATGRVGPCEGLAGTQTTTGVGNRRVGSKALIL